MFSGEGFGKFLQQGRERKRLDQKQMAARMALRFPERVWDQSVISKWERGTYAHPTDEQLRAWCEELNVGIVDLLIASGTITADDLRNWGAPVLRVSVRPEVWEELNLPPDLALSEATIMAEVLAALRRATARIRRRAEETEGVSNGEGSPRERAQS